MIDVHSHILSGMDDGARSFEESLEMAETAIRDGITHVVATPHANREFRFDYPRVRNAAAELQRAVGTRLRLSTGSDFHLSPENLAALKSGPAKFCIDQKDCLLVELNEFAIPPALDQTLYQIQLAGIRPIITHPERNAIVRSHPQRLAEWVRHGCYGQVTAGSLLGVFGPGSLESSWSWIERGLLHIVASDAHNTTGRPQKLRVAYNAVEKRFGRAKAEALFVENPLAVVEGRPLPHVPEIREARAKKKRFLFF